MSDASNSASSGPTTSIEIKINGNVYTDEAATPLRAEIETSLRMPAMAVLSFNDDSLHEKALDFSLDAEVEIAIPGAGATGDEKPIVFKGTVAALEAHREALTGVTVVRCYDALAKLYGPRKTRVFLKTKYSEIVTQVASDNAIPTGTINSDGPEHDYVLQYEESDGEFLERLAAECGFLLRLDATWSLEFGPPPELTKQPEIPSWSGAGPKQLVLGDDLTNYEITFGPKLPAGLVKTAGWDPAHGEAVTGQAEVKLENRGAVFQNLTPPTPEGDFLLSTIPFLIPQSAEATAKGVAEQVAHGFATLRGRVMGNAFIAAGVEIAVGAPENAFAGWYLVTSARQTFADGNLRTEFVCNGLGDRSAVSGGPLGVMTASEPANRMPSALTGIVTNVKDFGDSDGAKQLGRVKVQFPTLGWSEGESDWLRVVTPGAGNERGVWWLPEVGDEVLVLFDRGDVRSGYVLGGVHNGGSSKPFPDFADAPTTSGGQVKRRALTTTLGHQLIFSDEDHAESIQLKSGSGGSNRHQQLDFLFDQVAGVLTVTVTGDGQETQLKMDAASGDVMIKGSNNVTIEATQELVLKGNKVTIEAMTDVATKGVNIKSEATAGFEAKGVTAKVDGSAQLSLTAGAMAELKAGIVNINT